MSLLSVRGLSVEFATEHGWTRVIHDVDLDVAPGEVVGLVGESGSGKSVTSLTVMRLLPRRGSRVVSGEVVFDGRDLLTLPERQMEDVRGRDMAMVFQEPMTSLNPSTQVGRQIAEVLRRHRGTDRTVAERRAVEMIDRVGIAGAASVAKRYPHELSGGMRQRIMIAMALVCEPRMLLADEPTTALDVTIQSQILDLMREMQAELGLAMLFVTHDLGVVAELCDRVVVMYAGQVVEERSGTAIFERPRHPYSQGLLAASALVPTPERRLWTIPGAPPPPWHLPSGCRFAPRCPHAAETCRHVDVELVPDEGGTTRCVRVDEITSSPTGSAR